MKRLSRFLAVLALSAAVSCRRAPETSSRTVLTRHLVGDPASLDPLTSTDDEALLVEEMVFRPLVGIDGHRQPVPSLASSWTVSPDGLTYEFHLDPKFTWEDGPPVTSDDVRFTLERLHDPKVPAPVWRALFEDLAAVETPDAATVRVRFSKPDAQRMVAFTVPVVSAAAYTRAKDASETGRHPSGSGPYRLESWEANQKVRLVRRDGAANTDGKFDEILFRIIPEGSVRFQAGLRGELDEFRLSRDQMKTAQESPEFVKRYRILRVPQFMEVLVIWNCRQPFLADPRVRLALAHAWSREEAARRLYPPEGAALVSGPYPSGAVENAPELAPPAYDPALAARMLDEAGWKAGKGGLRAKGDRKASIELLYPKGGPIYDAVAEILRAAYEKVGVELVLRSLEWATFSNRSEKGECDAQFTGRVYWPPDLDPYPFYDSSQFAPGGQNIGFYKNAEADRVMQAGRAESDPARRLELYRQVARLFAKDPPADFLWDADQYWAMAKSVEGVEVTPLGLFHFLAGPLGWHPAAAPPR